MAYFTHREPTFYLHRAIIYSPSRYRGDGKGNNGNDHPFCYKGSWSKHQSWSFYHLRRRDYSWYSLSSLLACCLNYCISILLFASLQDSLIVLIKLTRSRLCHFCLMNYYLVSIPSFFLSFCFFMSLSLQIQLFNLIFVLLSISRCKEYVLLIYFLREFIYFLLLYLIIKKKQNCWSH